MRFWRTDSLWLALAGLLLLLTVWWFPGAGNNDTDSYSASFVGKKVFYRAVRQLDEDVFRSTDSLIPPSNTWDRLIILGPARSPTDAEWNALYDEVHGGATLIFAARHRDPNTRTGPFGARIVSFRSPPPVDEENAHQSDGNASDSKPQERDGPPSESKQATGESDDSKASSSQNAGQENVPGGSFRNRELIAETNLVEGQVAWKSQGYIECEADDWEVLLTADSRPQVVQRQLGEGVVVMAASDEIFTNGAMVHPERALLAYRILESAPTWGLTWFDETLNSSGTPKVLGILFDPLFRPMTLQLILIAVLFGWSGCHRFGPVIQQTGSRRRSVVEHAQALGILYFRARSGGHAVRCLHEYLNLELRRHHGSTFRVDNAEAVSRLAHLDESEVRDLFRQSRNMEAANPSTAVAARLLKRYSLLISRIRANHSLKQEKRTHGPPAN